jgi:hypothetical protein
MKNNNNRQFRVILAQAGTPFLGVPLETASPLSPTSGVSEVTKIQRWRANISVRAKYNAPLPLIILCTPYRITG